MFGPLRWFSIFRLGAVRLRRGSFARGACIAVLKFAQQKYNLSNELVEIRPLDLPVVSFEATDSMVMDAVYWYGIGGYEGIVASVWQELCASASNILEIGGNVGLFTVIGGRVAKGRYTVVEPVPEIAAVLRRNLQRNGLSGIEIIEAAAVPGDEPTVQLSIPNEGRQAPVGAHLVGGDIEVSGRSVLRAIVVRGASIRPLIAGRDLIKIDAEGAEFLLLSACRDILLAARPTMIIEVLPESQKLAGLLADLALASNYEICILPEYGADKTIPFPAERFEASVPRQFNAKDVLMTAR